MTYSLRLICFGLLILAITNGCRKKTILDEYDEWLVNPEVYDPYAYDCSNGDYDFDLGEGDVDCGEHCEPCSFYTPCLNTAKDELVYDGYTQTFTDSYSFFNDENQFVFVFSTDDHDDFIITVDSTVFRTNQRKLETQQYYNDVIAYKVHLTYETYFSGNFRASEGFDVFLVEQNGTQYFTFCDVKSYNQNFSDLIYSGSFKVPAL